MRQISQTHLSCHFAPRLDAGKRALDPANEKTLARPSLFRKQLRKKMRVVLSFGRGVAGSSFYRPQGFVQGRRCRLDFPLAEGRRGSTPPRRRKTPGPTPRHEKALATAASQMWAGLDPSHHLQGLLDLGKLGRRRKAFKRGREDRAGFGEPACRSIEFGQRQCRPQTPAPGAMLLRNRESNSKGFLRRRGIWRITLEQELATEKMGNDRLQRFSS